MILVVFIWFFVLAFRSQASISDITCLFPDLLIFFLYSGSCCIALPFCVSVIRFEIVLMC